MIKRVYNQTPQIAIRSFNALIFMCATHPNNTYFQDLKEQLHTCVKANEKLRYYFLYDKKHDYSPWVDTTIAELVKRIHLIPCRQNTHRTTPLLYEQKVRLENTIIDEEKIYLENVGRSLHVQSM